jgi:hypothetical protein
LQQINQLAKQVGETENMLMDPVEFGQMQADVQTLKQQMGEVRADVKSLLGMANQGKGGLWMFRTGYVLAGGILAWVVEHFVMRGPK